MPQLVKIPYGTGKHLLIEISDNGSQEIENLSRESDNAVKSIGQTLEAVSATIVETSQIMMAAFQSVATTPPPSTGKNKRHLSPKKATLEFGVRFTAEGNIYCKEKSN
jgi:hypothetical protein